LYFIRQIVNFKYHKNETDNRNLSYGYFSWRSHYLLHSIEGSQRRMQGNTRIYRIWPSINLFNPDIIKGYLRVAFFLPPAPKGENKQRLMQQNISDVANGIPAMLISLFNSKSSESRVIHHFPLTIHHSRSTIYAPFRGMGGAKNKTPPVLQVGF
jgi:hypothetical protein